MAEGYNQTVNDPIHSNKETYSGGISYPDCHDGGTLNYTLESASLHDFQHTDDADAALSKGDLVRAA